MLLGPFAGFALPLLPAQVLWVNLLTHGPVGVAMGSEPAAPDVLDRAPRRPSAGVLDRALVTLVLVAGTAVAGSCLLVAVVARAEGSSWQTQLFVTLTAGQLAVALALRPAGAWRAGRWLPVSVVGSASLLAAAVYAAPLQEVLGTQALSVPELAAALAAALPPVLAVLALRRTSTRQGTTR
jgi:Ca2+-transporting ATPase